MICFGDEAVDGGLGKLQGLFSRKVPFTLERDVSHLVFLRMKVERPKVRPAFLKIG